MYEAERGHSDRGSQTGRTRLHQVTPRRRPRVLLQGAAAAGPDSVAAGAIRLLLSLLLLLICNNFLMSDTIFFCFYYVLSLNFITKIYYFEINQYYQ